MNEKELEQWREVVAREIQQWRDDPNYIPILPVPVTPEMLKELDNG